MNYKEKYMKLKVIELIAVGIGLATVYVSIFAYWAISKGVITIG